MAQVQQDDDVNVEIPRKDHAKAKMLIAKAVAEFPELDPATMNRLSPMGCWVVHLRDGRHIDIWYDAPDGLTSGGRAVESGFGPNYYTTYAELRDAIHEALKFRDPYADAHDEEEEGEKKEEAT